tara:strand:+ start:1414 stop:2070 length:657 start_codon:yes stop_codon:yes gene_type:complete
MVKKKTKPRHKLKRTNHRISQSQSVNVKVLIPHAPKPIRRRKALKNPRSALNGGRSVQFIPPPLIQYDNSRIGTRENPIDLVKKEFDKIEKSLDAKITPLQQRFNTPVSRLEDDLGFQQAKRSVFNTQQNFTRAKTLGRVIDVDSPINQPRFTSPNTTTPTTENNPSPPNSSITRLNRFVDDRGLLNQLDGLTNSRSAERRRVSNRTIRPPNRLITEI